MNGFFLAMALCCQNPQQYGPVEVFWETTQGRWAEGQKIVGDSYGRYLVTKWREDLASLPRNSPQPAVSTTTTTATPTPKQLTPTPTAPGEKPFDILATPEKEVQDPGNGETLAPVVRTNVQGYGDCEARQILKSPVTENVGKFRVTRTFAPPGDPYGFLQWLNATRAQYGLAAVGHDQNLSNWAAENNNHQAARGMGHFVMGPARRQNAAWGANSAADVGLMWMNSGGHRAALLDPTIRWMGIAAAGAYWTFNAY